MDSAVCTCLHRFCFQEPVMKGLTYWPALARGNEIQEERTTDARLKAYFICRV